MTDEALVSRFANGDNQAFDILLNRHKNRVYTYILLIVRNRDLAEDVFQETFMKAIVTIKQGRYVDSGKFYAWVTRIAHNLIIDIFRKERNENTISNDEFEDVDLFNNPKFSDENVEDRLVKNQVMKDVSSLVRMLPDSQKRWWYCAITKLSFKDIADQTVSYQHSLGRMRYAVLNMRRMAEGKTWCCLLNHRYNSYLKVVLV